MTSEVVDAVTVRALDADVPHVLHQHYPGELSMQPCHIELDLESGELTADYNPEIGNAVPMRVFHGIVRWWSIPCLVSTEANGLLEQITPLAERVLAGAAVEWNGSNNVAVLNEDAAQAEQEIIGFLDENTDLLDLVVEMDAGEWFSEGDLPDGLTADTTDDELDAIVAEQEREAAGMDFGRYTVLLGTEEFLTARREEMRDAVRDELETVAEQHKDLEGQRNELIVRVKAFGDSDRQVGGRAGMTHTAVQYIVAKKQVEAKKTDE